MIYSRVNIRNKKIRKEYKYLAISLQSSLMKTPFHNYNTPNEGTEDWHIPLNENFEKLDADIEIRGPEAEKGEYEPKKGSKYEAVDSGAVYYGDGDAWVLADRQVDAFNVNILSAGKLFNDTHPGTAIVAPSVPSAYNKIQYAIDDGFRDVWLCEDVEESGIALPPDTEDGLNQVFRLRGMSEQAVPVIKDPQTGDPVIVKPRDQSTHNVIIENIGIKGGVNSVSPINLIPGGADTPTRPAGFVFKNVFSGGGAWRIGAGRHMLINCRNQNIRTEPRKYYGADAWPSLKTTGATFAMYGGVWKTQKGDHNTIIGSGAFSITGGVTFNNSAKKSSPETIKNGDADLGFQGAGRGLISGFSCEMGNVDIRMGLEESDTTAPGLQHSVITAPSIGGGNSKATIEVNKPSQNVSILNPVSEEIVVEKNDRSRMLFMTGGGTNITVNGEHPQDVSKIGWGGDGQIEIGNVDGSYTQFKEDIVSSEPKYPQAGSSVIADGTNWDPQGTGNAAKVVYNGSEWVVDTDLESPL